MSGGILDHCRASAALATRRRVVVSCAMALFAALTLIGGYPGLGLAQESSDGSDTGVYFPSDRLLMQRLTAASELLNEQRYSEAVRLLGGVLESPQDFFFQPDGTTQGTKGVRSYLSLKAEARRLLSSLPAAGRESYELQYGDEARKLLEVAVASGEVERLAEVSRRFFHTKAGQEATWLLGLAHMNNGQPLAAAFCFQRLQSDGTATRFEPELSLQLALCWSRAGMATEADAALNDFGQRLGPAASVQVAGSPQKLASGGEALKAWFEKLRSQDAGWLASLASEWLVHRGNAMRNAVSDGSSPLLNRRWAVSTSNDPALESAITEVRASYWDQATAVLPVTHPLAVGDYVFTRTVSGLLAVDFRTGKRIWHGPTDEAVRELLEAPGQERNISQLTSVWLDRRIWDDSVYGLLSSDGERVYCIEDLGNPEDELVRSNRMVIMPNGAVQGSTGAGGNRLAAYEIATEGKLAWDVGKHNSQHDEALADAYFLGPPMPLGDTLYVMAEVRGEVRLLAINARDGALQWWQQLAVVEQSTREDPLRRLSGATPSYADGVLVCPISAGAAVAVDFSTRSLLWGYEYGRAGDSRQNRIMMFQISSGMMNGGQRVERWTDASATIAEGCVLLTPPESGELHCVSLHDGKLLWKKPREDGLYVGCVHQGVVLVVGRGNVRGYRLQDGKTAWSSATVTLPSGAIPSGRGFFTGQRYHLPQSNGEVAAIDVATGKIVARSRSRSGGACGNLICYRGSVISQSAGELESFYQLDDLRDQVAARLEKDMHDPAALSLRGELHLDEGQIDEAIDHLRRSYAMDQDSRTQRLLIEAMIEGLRLDFPKYRQLVPELEGLVDSPAQRIMYLKELALGLQRTGEVLPAYEAYLKMMDFAQVESPSELERIDATLSVRRDRWLQARMAELQLIVDGDDVARVERLLRERLTGAAAQDQTDALESFVRQFAYHPLADEARVLLVERLPDTKGILYQTRLLQQMERSKNPEIARVAAARLALELSKTGMIEDVRPYLNRLEGEWANEVCLANETGRQVAQRVLSGFESQTTKLAPWPMGNVSVEPISSPSNSAMRVFPIEVRGTQSPFYEHRTIEFDQSRQTIVGRDGLGQVLWNVPLTGHDQARRYASNPTVCHALADGHLVVLSFGQYLMAIDTLGVGIDNGSESETTAPPRRRGRGEARQPGSESGTARVLWRNDLSETGGGNIHVVGMHGRMVNMPWGLPRFVASDAFGNVLGNMGPVTADVVCFQKRRTLFAVDPLTGETLWTRTVSTAGCDTLGDEEMIFIIPPEGNEALVVSALDGRELGRRKVPSTEQRMIVMGRRVVTWSSSRGKKVLAMRDMWENKELWSHEFASTAKPWPVANRSVAVMDRQGKFAMVGVEQGNIELQAELSPESSLSDIFALRTADRDILIVNRPVRNRQGVNPQPVPGGFANPLINGMVYGFDRATGKLVYSTAVEDMGVTLSQPTHLPVLVFAAQTYRQQRNNNSRINSPEVAIMCIDKRTGRAVYSKKDLAGPITGVEVMADAEKHQVMLRTARASVRLQFTDEPIEAEASEASADSDSSTGSGEKSTGQKTTDSKATDSKAASEKATDQKAAK